MSILSLRSAVTTAGGTPTQWSHVGLLRELITAWRGTPTRWSIAGLLKEAVITAGGTTTKVEQMTLLRELITALGGSPTSFNADTLWAQLATLANIPVSGAPVATVQPAVSGTLRTGSALSTTNGTWTNVPSSYAYQWFRGATAVGTNASSYTLVSADEGSNITCRVAATNATGTGFSTSNAVGPVLPLAPTNSVAPVASGTATQGQTLSVSNGTWANSPTSYAYQWKRDGASIGSATANTYLLVAGDVGTNVTCTVTASNAGGSTAATSNAIGPVSAAGGLSAPVLTRTSASGTNRMDWQGYYAGTTPWDGVDSGDKVDMRFRVNGGAWTNDTRQVLDAAALLTGSFAWPVFNGTTFAAGAFVEAQEMKLRFVAGVQTDASQWSNIVSDTMAAVPFSPADLFGAENGYAWNTTDLSQMWQLNGGTSAAAFASPVGKLVDISGKGNHFLSTGNDSTRPTLQNVNNGLIQFDGSNDRLRLAAAMLYAAGSMTLMFAGKITPVAANFLFSEGLNAGGPLYAPGTRQLGAAGEDCLVQITDNGSSSWVATTINTNAFDSTIHIFTIIDSGTLFTIYVDGISIGTVAYSRSGHTVSLDNTFLGCWGPSNVPESFLTGYLGCGGGYGRVLGGPHTTANSELNKLYNWIAGKHGLATL